MFRHSLHVRATRRVDQYEGVRGSEVENGLARALEGRQARVKVGCFTVEVEQLRSELADLENKPRVVLEQVANSVSCSMPWSIQLGLFDEAFGKVEGLASHNGTYIKFRPELAQFSGRNST